MAYSAKKAISNKKSDAKYSQMLLKPYKAEAEQIRAAAQASGQSLQGYILQACRVAMDPATVPVLLAEDGVTPEAVQQAAEAEGMSVNAWIIQAIKDKL